MKFLIVLTLAFATVWAKDLYSRLIEVPVLKSEGRITKGQNADPGQFYYQVGLFLERGKKLFWCSGSLISETWILSAGHCTYKVSLVSVYLGATKRLVPEKVHNVSESDLSTHPNFNPIIYRNDISLIRIPPTAQSRGIGIIRISSKNDEYVGDSVVVAGWGFINENTKALSNNLQYAILKVSPASICSAVYLSLYNHVTNLCVATPNKVSTCEGDSGSPLVLEDENLQIGLDSFIKIDGCHKGNPVVFTRVSAYRFWIKALAGIL